MITKPVNKQSIIQNNKDVINGLKCVTKPGTARGCSVGPILSCKHKRVESCHTTQSTVFTPAMYDKCEEVYEKTCYIHNVPCPVNHRGDLSHTAHNTSAHPHCLTSYQTVCTKTYNQTDWVVCEAVLLRHHHHARHLCGERSCQHCRGSRNWNIGNYSDVS